MKKYLSVLLTILISVSLLCGVVVSADDAEVKSWPCFHENFDDENAEGFGSGIPTSYVEGKGGEGRAALYNISNEVSWKFDSMNGTLHKGDRVHISFDLKLGNAVESNEIKFYFHYSVDTDNGINTNFEESDFVKFGETNSIPILYFNQNHTDWQRVEDTWTYTGEDVVINGSMCTTMKYSTAVDTTMSFDNFEIDILQRQNLKKDIYKNDFCNDNTVGLSIGAGNGVIRTINVSDGPNGTVTDVVQFEDNDNTAITSLILTADEPIYYNTQYILTYYARIVTASDNGNVFPTTQGSNSRWSIGKSYLLQSVPCDNTWYKLNYIFEVPGTDGMKLQENLKLEWWIDNQSSGSNCAIFQFDDMSLTVAEGFENGDFETVSSDFTSGRTKVQTSKTTDYTTWFNNYYGFKAETGASIKTGGLGNAASNDSSKGAIFYYTDLDAKIYDVVNLKPGGLYHITGYTKAGSRDSAGPVQIGIDWDDGTASSVITTVRNNKAQEWKMADATFTVPDNCTGDGKIWFKHLEAESGDATQDTSRLYSNSANLCFYTDNWNIYELPPAYGETALSLDDYYNVTITTKNAVENAQLLWVAYNSDNRMTSFHYTAEKINLSDNESLTVSTPEEFEVDSCVKVMLWRDMVNCEPISDFACKFQSTTPDIYIYVDAENGSDTNDGSSSSPLRTITKARDVAKEYAPDMESDIKVLMRGTFYLDDTFVLDETNSGYNGHNIIYTSWGEEKPVITMAREFTDFECYDEAKEIYRVFVGVGFNTRQAYFNDVRGIRSRSIGYLENIEYVSEEAVFLCDSKELLTYEHINDVECIWNVNWTNQRAIINSATETDDGRVKIDFYSDFNSVKSRIDARPGAYAQNPVYIENAYELLDEQGEWYMNKYDGYMYYIPRDSDDMDNMVLKVPCGERLIDASGADYNTVLKNIKFDNIKFEGTTWLYPDEAKVYNAEQNGRMKIDGTMQIAGSAVQFDKCKYISITNCIFTQLGSRAVIFKNGAKHIDVVGNEFYDIAGGAFLIDDYSLDGYPTRDARTICEYVSFNNNYVHNTSFDYKGEAAVSFGWLRHSEFNHNEITNIPYTGIHGSYGWASYASTGTTLFDVEVNYNYIHDIFNDRVYDGAAIYFVGASSLECEKTNKELNNRCFGNYITHGWSNTYLYPDQGTTSWYYKDNVIDSTGTGDWEYNLFDTPKAGGKFFMHMHSSSIKWLTVENTYSTLDYGYANGYMNGVECNIEPAHIYPDANWPDEAKEIINNAGIEPEYKGNFNLDGPNYFAAPSRKPRIDNLETPTDIGLTVYDAQGKQYSLSDFEIDWWISDPEALSIDDNGLFTAHKSAVVEAVGVIKFDDGTIQLHHFRVFCGDAE